LRNAQSLRLRESGMEVSEPEKSYIKQRQTQRHRDDRAAWIDAGDGSQLQKCTLWDASDAGVRLTVDTPNRVPFEFCLVLSKDGKLRRRCRVRWRSADQIGACFVPGPSPF
jgi:hypothetical protein